MKKPTPVFDDIVTILGEGPVWDPVEQKIYWIDINGKKIFRSEFPAGTPQTFELALRPGSLALREKGGLVLATKKGFGFFDDHSQKLTLLPDSPEKDNPNVRYNDGVVDPAGRFFAGTMDAKESRDLGKLFCLDTNLQITELEKGIYISNGMGWSLDHKNFFYIDTLAHCVWCYDYDITTGGIANRKNYIEFETNEYPDGMTIDSEGGFWIAFWGGSKIGHYDAKGQLIENIRVPATQPTSVCFGGPDMKTLFITTASRGLSAQQLKETPLAGRLFILETDTVGRIEPRFAG